MTTQTRKPTEALWHRVTQPDVPIDVAPMVRDALRMERLNSEIKVRRATVKRIFEAAHRNSHFDGAAFAALRAILDEVANAQEELRTADAKAAR